MSRTKLDRLVDDELTQFAAQRPLRSGSLIVTVFGDSLAPRGGSVWLGSLIAALKDFGLSERLVRTAVFRLAREDWLAARQIGRRSFYSITDAGRTRFAEASQRIYGGAGAPWNGSWCLVLLSGIDSGSREQVRRELGWLGFGAFSTAVLAHPSPDRGAVRDTLARLDVESSSVVFSASEAAETVGAGLQGLVNKAWSLDELASRYLDFLERFRPLYHATERLSEVRPATAFRLRTLLIHEYRRILLRDPRLPTALLPAGWPGSSARHLCRNLYFAISDQADEYLTSNMETSEGPLPSPEPAVAQRFNAQESIQ